MRDYIPVKNHWVEMYIKPDRPYFTPHIKFPIEKIKIDKSLFAYPNEVSPSAVLYMLANFDREAWMPILLNKEHYLLDGQHRLEVARQMGLFFIDVIIEDPELLEGDSKKADEGNKGRPKKITRHEAKLKKLKAELIMLERRLDCPAKTQKSTIISNSNQIKSIC